MITEVEILGWVAEGHYVPSLHAIFVEGEVGVVTDLPGLVPTDVNETEFPGFSGRGYAVLDYFERV